MTHNINVVGKKKAFHNRDCKGGRLLPVLQVRTVRNFSDDTKACIVTLARDGARLWTCNGGLLMLLTQDKAVHKNLSMKMYQAFRDKDRL